MYFVNSMSDLFQDGVPFEFVDDVMEVIESTPWHTYQILTKRSERMCEYFDNRVVPDNAWLGVSVEDKKYGKPRIPDRAGLGLARLACVFGDPDRKLQRISAQTVEAGPALWVLSHVDLRTTARVRIFRDFLVDELEKQRDLIEGRRRV
jgi:hypothetical protein